MFGNRRCPNKPRTATSWSIKISGAVFIRATAPVLTVLDRLPATPRLLVLDFAKVPLIDTAAARPLVAFVNKLKR